MMEFQIKGLTENWLIFKKDGRGVEFQGTHVVCIVKNCLLRNNI